MSYTPLDKYGLIGNMRTAALVSIYGSIDWLCLPQFDSPSIFARVLDHTHGGCFCIRPASEHTRFRQFYWPDTNILVSRFLSQEGIAEIQDFMPVGGSVHEGNRNQIIRIVRVARGRVCFRLNCEPAFDYARERARVHIGQNGAVFEANYMSLSLQSSIALERGEGAATAQFTFDEGQSAIFVLQPITEGESCKPAPSREKAYELFQSTVDYWRRWLSQSTYDGRWRGIVHRSALTLKLLTFEPTGAIVAAPTCGLPDAIGSDLNWDYRYTWIRDAAFTLYGFLRLGFTSEASAFVNWLLERLAEPHEGAPLRVCYSIDGRHEIPEATLDHLEGYRKSKPVRVGNAACTSFQLDIYGELLDSIYLSNKYSEPLSYDAWVHVRRLVNWVCKNWHRKDAGIWEFRSSARHFVYSKIMCWVALDRGLRLAQKRSFPADEVRWLNTRNAIYEEVFDKGWNAEMGAFTQTYGSKCLDGSNLIMPMVFFSAPSDPRMLSTLDATCRSPAQGGLTSDGLVYRYDPQRCGEGLEGEHRPGTFNMCSFWLVEALTRAGRHDPKRLEEARLAFERILGYANHLGLYSERTGVSGEALGNFPQAFTHLALISAAYNLNRAIE